MCPSFLIILMTEFRGSPEHIKIGVRNSSGIDRAVRRTMLSHLAFAKIIHYGQEI
jgi:hypothetical protein